MGVERPKGASKHVRRQARVQHGGGGGVQGYRALDARERGRDGGEGERKGGKHGEREGARTAGTEGLRDRQRERGRKAGREGGSEDGREGPRERGRERTREVVGVRQGRTRRLPVRISSSVMGRRHCWGMLKRSRSEGRTPSHLMSGVVRLLLSYDMFIDPYPRPAPSLLLKPKSRQT